MTKKNVLLVTGLAVALTAGVVSCVSSPKAPERNVAGIIDIFKEWNATGGYAETFRNESRARKLDTEYILKHASSAKLPLTEAEIIIDNDAAFDSKIQAIRDAKKTIRLTYFIYADDDSSSVMTSELIKKAQAGVKVKLLVDFITNYSRLDLFTMMEKEGRGNIEVRFYNFPSERIQADAKYMSLPCPQAVKPEADECSNYKQGLMTSTPLNTFFGQMMLAGIYGKNPVAIQTALGLGGQLDPAQFKNSGAETSPEDKAQLIEFLKLYFDAKIKKDFGAMIKLYFAMMMYGEKLNPIVNEISGRLPLISDKVLPGRKTTHSEEWDHLTDYTHHKLIAVDGREFQLGGRNVEDSYHMKSRLGTKGKYIFMDTDFRVETTAGGASEVEASFDKTFNFSEMVAPLSKVLAVMPIDLVSNNEALGEAAVACGTSMKKGELKYEQLATCVETNMKKNSAYVSTETRTKNLYKEMVESVKRYTKDYAKAGKKTYRDNITLGNYKEGVNKLSAQDLKTAEIYYVENTSFDLKEKDTDDVVRRVGARIGAESFFNKHIHKLWYRGLENACYVSRKQQKDVRVVLHSAYLFMPSGMVHKLTKMLNGDYGDCSKVHLTILTNSFQTTDLNVINVFARYQLAQIFKHYQALVNNSNSNARFVPKMDYFEYNASAVGAGVSLHTKLSLLGDDMIIGSANADTRSYAMDTNNAVFIRNAFDLNKNYNRYINALISDKARTTELGPQLAQLTDEQIKTENDYILGAMLCRWDKKAKNCPASLETPFRATQIESERFPQSRVKDMLETIDRTGQKVSYTTYRILNFRGEFDENGHFSGREYNQGADQRLERELNKISNEFDDLFKVL